MTSDARAPLDGLSPFHYRRRRYPPVEENVGHFEQPLRACMRCRDVRHSVRAVRDTT